MPPKKELNPGEEDYRTKISQSLNNQEKTGNNFAADDATNLKDTEETADNEWSTNVLGKEGDINSHGKTKGNGFFKKKGPIASLLLILGCGGVGIAGLLSPSLLIVHVKETLVDKFNYQLTSMELRTNKILKSKIDGTTTGICGSKISIKCKYSTMSDKQITNFKKAGIEVTGEKNSLGRTKPTSFTYNGEEISAKDFSQKYKSNANFRSAVKQGYNPKFAGFADKIWNKAANTLKGLSKKATKIEGDTYDDKLNNLDESITDKSGLKLSDTNIKEGDTNPDTNEPYTAEDVKTAEANKKLLEEAGEGSILSKLGKGVDEIGNMIKITGPLDDGCAVYRTFRAVGFAAKTVRVIALAQFAWTILNVADQIKAGDATPEDTEFIGKLLTDRTEDEYGNLTSATDSAGYKYAAYGDIGAMSLSSMNYMAAAGVSGIMINFFESFPKATKTTCNILGNPIVGLLSLAVGGLSFATGIGETKALAQAGGKMSAKVVIETIKSTIKKGVKEAIKDPTFWTGTGLAFAEWLLPDLLKNIIAGTVIDSSTVGANAGDALTSGAAVIMGQSAKSGGNAPLTPTQAVAYNNLSQEVAAVYASEDQATHSPFDISNKNTFLGSIVSNLTPYLSKMSSLSSIFDTMSSLLSKTFTSVFSLNTKASANISDYETCQDVDYRDLGVATDPFCNVIYGIPTEDLDIDPNTVADYLLNNNDIDESGDTISGSSYEKFQKTCINRTDPLGYSEDGSDDGSECFYDANPSNKYYYLYYIDQRVLDGIENGYSNETPQNTGNIIAIDAGHQAEADSEQEEVGPGADTTKVKVTSGTSGTTSDGETIEEYELNLTVAKKLQTELLGRGYQVCMIRDTNDVKISNKERAQKATDCNAVVYIRIHADGAEEEDGGSAKNGISILTPSDNNQYLSSDIITKSRKLSEYILNTMITTTRANKAGTNNTGISERDDLTGTNWSTMPVSLVEMGFMSNQAEMDLLATNDYQNKIAMGIADGIDEYFGL